MQNVSLSTDGGTEDLAGVVTVSATVTKPITRADFYVNGNLVGSDSADPYSYSWDTTVEENGPNALKARVYYSRNQAAEGTLQVTVLNFPIPGASPEPPPEQAPELVEE
jgi:subtilase family serine protease